MRRYLYVSLAAAFGVIALKLGAWYLTGSVGFLSDALESLVNVVAAGFALFIVGIAGRPPDSDHPYGHTKAEYFSSALEGMLIGVAALAIAAEAVRRLLSPQPVHAVPAGAALNLLATLINLGVARWMLGGAQRMRSIVLEADARHLLADVWTSVGVLIGVALVPLTGWLWLDPMVGIVVAGHITGEGWRLVARSVDGLMDRSLPAADLAEVERVLQGFRSNEVRFDHVRTRRAGTRRFVGMHMHMPAHWSLGRAADFRLQVERALTRHIAGVVVTIEMLPQGQESLQEGGAEPGGTASRDAPDSTVGAPPRAPLAD